MPDTEPDHGYPKKNADNESTSDQEEDRKEGNLGGQRVTEIDLPRRKHERDDDATNEKNPRRPTKSVQD